MTVRNFKKICIVCIYSLCYVSFGQERAKMMGAKLEG